METRTLLSRTLSVALTHHALVTVHRDHISGKPLTGTVVGWSDSYVQLALYDRSAHYAGTSVVCARDITRVERGGARLASIEHLERTPVEVPVADLSSISRVLWTLTEQHACISLHTEYAAEPSAYVGAPEHASDEWVLLHTFGPLASPGIGELLIRKGEISRVHAGGAYERAIHRAAHERNATR